MTVFDVFVEAQGYGDPAADGEALLAALEQAGFEDPSVAVDEGRGMLLVQLVLEGASALDVHGEAVELWRQAWEEAFEGQAPPLRFAARVVPAEVPAGTGS